MEVLSIVLRLLAYLLAPFRHYHTAIQAYVVKKYRTHEVLKVYKVAHAAELAQTPVASWPITVARHRLEIQAINAGKLDVVDRKSWTFPFLPASVQRLSVPIMKGTPYNLRRLSRTPVPRRAINLVKNAVIAQPWELRPVDGVEPIDNEDGQKERIKIGTRTLKHPNNSDSFQTFLEQGIEDLCTFGALAAELKLTPDPERPVKLWNVTVESIRIFAAWAESTPDMPHYAQMTGLKGERGAVLFFDDELLYIRDNPATDNPFGLGKMEVGFASISDFLGVQGMAGRSGSDQVHKCFPEWTEVLTRRGWLHWRDVNETDEFATRSIDGRLQWQHALAFVKEPHDGELIQFKNRNLTITVTPNHRMYGWQIYKDQKTGKRLTNDLGFIEAKDLLKAVADRPGKGWRGSAVKHAPVLADFKIPAKAVWLDGALPSSECQLGDKTYKWEDWAALLGIWVAEGSCLGSGRGLDAKEPNVPLKGEYRVQIAQSRRANPTKYKEIENLLRRMGLYYRREKDRFLFTDRELWTYLSALGNSHTKRVPQWVKDAPASIIRVFVDWAVKGDGSVHRSSGKRVYYTASVRLANDMQELFQKIGSSAAIRGYQDGPTFMYAVEEMLRDEISIIPDKGRGKARMPKRVPYTGMVYCAMVPNGTLYCRENGYAFWSGNTWLWWEQPQADSSYQIVRRHIQNELEGQAKVSIIGGMKKPDVLEINPVTPDDLLLDWQEMLIRMIANAFDMSAMALGIEHDINRAVGQVLDDKDFRSAVVPMAKRLMEAFTRRILHNKLGWYDLEFAFLDLDDPDIETKSALLARMYSANALKPNEWRKAMRMPKLDSPFAELTQAEQMLVNIDAQAQAAEEGAQNNFNRQLTMMQIGQSMQTPPDEQAQPAQDEVQPGKSGKPTKQLPPAREDSQPAKGAGGNAGNALGPKITPGTVSRGGQPPSPKPLGLPKFPISGTIYTAKQIARMPVNQIADVFYSSGASPLRVWADMQHQEPGILEQLSDEVREFFDEAIQREADQPKVKLPRRVFEQWRKDLTKRISKDSKRPNDFALWLRTKSFRNASGLPGKAFGPTGYNPKAGKPGNINPVRRG